MTKKIILTALLVVLFASVLIGAYFGYKHLSERSNSNESGSITTETPDKPDGQKPNGQDSGGQGTSDKKGNFKDFTVKDKDGNPVKLSSFIGKPVVINFWASWCPPCRAELPHFDKLAKEYDGRVTFLMVNLSGENKDTVVNFVNKNNYTFPLYFDDTDSGANAYAVSSIPVTVFINADGNVADRRVGAMSEAVLKNYITKLF